MNDNALIIYHADCSDGFCAAWVASRALGCDRLHEGRHGEDPPLELAKGRDVLVLDFSYPRPQLEQLAAVAKSLTVLDHHKTAAEELRGFPGCIFDMERSGAGMAWDHFHPGEPRPWIVDYVEDRDLWRFALPDSREVSLFIRTVPQRLAAYDRLAEQRIGEILGLARGALAYIDHYIANALRSARRMRLDAWQAIVVNCTHAATGEVLHAALERDPEAQLALGWYVDGQGAVVCSLRSRAEVDCSGFATAHGGGGHAQASGFKVDGDVVKVLCFLESMRSEECYESPAFVDGRARAYHDGCEDAWYTSVGGRANPELWRVPGHVLVRDRERWIAGYAWCVSATEVEHV